MVVEVIEELPILLKSCLKPGPLVCFEIQLLYRNGLSPFHYLNGSARGIWNAIGSSEQVRDV